MRSVTRLRLTSLIALVAFGVAVTFAVADSLTLIGPRTIEPHGEVAAPIGSATDTDEPASPAHDELGAIASGGAREAERRNERKEAKSSRGDREGDGAETEQSDEPSDSIIPAVIDDGGQLTLPCTEVDSCVERVGRLITDVRATVPELETVPELLPIRGCTSSIGGEALCVDFGDGNYLVGDAPYDGEAELGFCTSSGYYHVTGPSLEGGVGAACPDDPDGSSDSDGGDAPTMRECTSSNGAEAVCFDFADGSYIVYDAHDDGESELGFCSSSGYSFISAPTGEGQADAKCPKAVAAD
jgi:hypothetical protein